MIILPEKIKRCGIEYTQVKRCDKAAMYSLALFDSPKIIGYDVFLIKQQKEGEYDGIKFQAKERFPNDEAFGVWAWSFSTFETAETKYAEILHGCPPVNRLRLPERRGGAHSLWVVVKRAKSGLHNSKKTKAKKSGKITEREFISDDWHTWVYGSGQNPRK